MGRRNIVQFLKRYKLEILINVVKILKMTWEFKFIMENAITFQAAEGDEGEAPFLFSHPKAKLSRGMT
jgi:hypothetical protein